MDEFKGIIDYCISELIDNALKELKNDDKYAKLDSRNDKLMAKIEKMTDKLSDDERKLITDFCDGLMELSGTEQRHFYKSGFRDCMRLMKIINK